MASAYTPRLQLKPLLILLIVSGCLLALLSLLNATLPTDPRQTLPEGMSVTYGYLTGTDTRDPDDALSQPFTPGKPRARDLDFNDHHQWYRVDLKNVSPRDADIVLAIDNPIADYIAVYKLEEGRPPELQKVLGEQGVGLSRQERALPHHRLTIPAYTSRATLVYYATEGTPFFPLLTVSQADFDSVLLSLNQIWAALFGVTLLVCFYHFMLFAVVGDMTYLLYCAFMLAMVGSLGLSGGFIHLLLPEVPGVWLSEQIIFVNGLLLSLVIVFSVYFLRIHEMPKRAGRILGLSTVLAGLSAVTVFLPEYLSGPAFAAVHAAAYLMLVYLISIRFRERLPWTRLYLLSWIPFFVTAGLTSALLQGLLEYNGAYRLAFIGAVAFQFLCMSLALTDRFAASESAQFFNATHDQRFDMATRGLLESHLEAALEDGSAGAVGVISVEIQNYQQVAPFLCDDDLKQLVRRLADRVVQRFAPAGRFMTIDPMAPTLQNACLLSNGVISFALDITDEAALQNVLAGLEVNDNHNPIPDVVPYRIECGLGVARHGDQSSTAGLINDSLLALNLAKQYHRPYYIHSSNDADAIERRIRLAQDLDQALHEDALQLYYQPQFNLRAPESLHAEALLRWEHPEFGFINPEEIVAIAENTGLIHRLTEWVINAAFSLPAKVGGDRPLHVSVNVSAYDLSQLHFYDYVMELARRRGVRPEHFTLELTESARGSEDGIIRSNIIALTDRGFRFSLDDFGTGYAALSYAASMPIQELKLDRSFTAKIHESERFRTIMGSVAHMARALSIGITAEGVENARQARSLAALGCEHLQGYWIARPLCEGDYLAWVAQLPQHIARLTTELRDVPGDGPRPMLLQPS